MPRILLAAGAALLLVAGILAAVFHGRTVRTATAVTVTLPAPTTTALPPPPPPPAVAMSWQSAGGMVVHPSAIDPAQLGTEMRAAGFGWLAVDLDDLDPGWIARFRSASGLPVGGWSVLGDDAAGAAAAAVQAIQQNDLAFYIADAEQSYGYTQGAETSPAAYARSRQFVQAFRAAEPSLPAALSSFCRPDEHDLDWSAWAAAGFDFLPQAYVNDLGSMLAPSACAAGARRWFPLARVHPTVGSYSGTYGIVSPARWLALLRRAHTTGFSIYPAEVGTSPQDYAAYGAGLGAVARVPVGN
jgi:hypothetical protein